MKISLVKLTYGGVERANFEIPIEKLATSSHIHLEPGFSSGTEVFKDMFHIASQVQTKLQNIRNACIRT